MLPAGLSAAYQALYLSDRATNDFLLGVDSTCLSKWEYKDVQPLQESWTQSQAHAHAASAAASGDQQAGQDGAGGQAQVQTLSSTSSGDVEEGLQRVQSAKDGAEGAAGSFGSSGVSGECRAGCGAALGIVNSNGGAASTEAAAGAAPAAGASSASSGSTCQGPSRRDQALVEGQAAGGHEALVSLQVGPAPARADAGEHHGVDQLRSARPPEELVRASEGS